MCFSKANRHKLRAPSNQFPTDRVAYRVACTPLKNALWTDGPTDGQTDGQMDRQTDGRTYPLQRYIDASKIMQINLNKANRHKSRAPSIQRQTDRPTDRPTDRVAYRVACTRLKRYVPQKIP